MELKPMNIIAGIMAGLTLFGAVIAFDARYTKHDDFIVTMSQIKIDIINEMRREVVKNRTVMIIGMQREADDLEYRMTELEKKKKLVPRYMSEKHRQILRQIEALKNDDNDEDDSE